MEATRRALRFSGFCFVRLTNSRSCSWVLRYFGSDSSLRVPKEPEEEREGAGVRND